MCFLSSGTYSASELFKFNFRDLITISSSTYIACGILKTQKTLQNCGRICHRYLGKRAVENYKLFLNVQYSSQSCGLVTDH